MHLIRCLAFITAKFQFLLSASHIPGVENTAADALSRNKVVVFLQANFCSCTNSSSPPRPSLAIQTRLDVLELDRYVEQYFHLELAPSNRRTYSSAQHRYLLFCSHHHFTPSPFSVTLPKCSSSSSVGTTSFYYKMLIISNQTTSYCTGGG